MLQRDPPDRRCSIFPLLLQGRIYYDLPAAI